MENTTTEYLQLLSNQYPTIQKASTEIINLKAILNLPKATEHFMSDIHGEYEAFIHLLYSGSGVVKRRINEVFRNSLTTKEKKGLATLIYYPKAKLSLVLKTVDDKDEWFKVTLHRLILVCRSVTSKYTRSKVRKSLPKDFAYIIEELLHEAEDHINKQEYYDEIIETIIQTRRADAFIIAISTLIKNMVVDKLHIVGDIFDRGPSPDKILDKLIEYKKVDFQWGNHDILWMGAALGLKTFVATVLRICARYYNLDIIEDGYGINIYPLASLAIDYYKDDPCTKFMPKIDEKISYNDKYLQLVAQMHKAIAVIQFKLEAGIIKRHPGFEMNDRLLLDKIDYKKGTVIIDGKEYTLNDKNFPTIDPKDPYKLNTDEQEIINRLTNSFVNNEKLQRHVKFLFDKGSMFLIHNSNLMYHGCIPFNENNEFQEVQLEGKKYKGQKLISKFDELVRSCYLKFRNGELTEPDLDYIYYLWPGSYSPLFGKKKMATFERYFVDDKTTHKENSNPYFSLREKEEICNKILTDFNLNHENSHIVNGHMPVKLKKGESPVKGNGKLIVIDGGLARAYQNVTGNAGYTLIYNSYGLILTAHKPFSSQKEAIENEIEILSSMEVLNKSEARIRVGDTDNGKRLKKQIKDLEALLQAYRNGSLKESV